MKAILFKLLNDSVFGSILITVLIFASVTIFSLETEYPNLKLLQHLDIAIALIFMTEYLARIWTADYAQLNKTKGKSKARLSYIFSLYGLVDLIAFLPVLLFPAVNNGGGQWAISRRRK